MAERRCYHTCKRAIDILVSAVVLLVSMPLLAGVALLVRLRLGRPVLFRQERPGLHGEVFRLYKFRTMLQTRDAAGELLSDERRLSGLGAWLRAQSLDELPQFWNVLRGELSLVGPRPLLVEYLGLYTREQARRHLVKPGITGWAQVNGRNAVSWEERFAMDCWYVDHCSLQLDAVILLRTIGLVLRREGISHADSSTMVRFEGHSGPGDPGCEGRRP
jgi:sugar transferase EpsL